jgi:hypothetical protein
MRRMSKGADKDDRRRQMLAGAYSAVTVNSSACGSTSYLVIDEKDASSSCGGARASSNGPVLPRGKIDECKK